MRELSYKTILMRRNLSVQESVMVDVPVEVDLSDWEVVKRRAQKVARAHPIDGILSLNEYYVPLASYLAEQLGIPNALPLEGALNCRSKIRTREALERAGVPSARFRLAQSPEEGATLAGELGFPVVVKPANDSNSRSVLLCGTEAEVADAVKAILDQETNGIGQAMERSVLIEEYIQGPEFSAEAFTFQGQTTLIACLSKMLGPAPKFVEIGHTYPAALSEDQQQAVLQLLSDAFRALNVDNCVTHTEFRWTSTGPRIIEVNARVAGGRIAEMVEVITGYDMLKVAGQIAMGKHPSPAAPKAGAGLYRSVTFPGTGLVHYDPAYRAPHVGDAPQLAEMDVESDDYVFGINDSRGGMFGRILAYGENVAHAEEQYQAILSNMGLTWTAVDETVQPVTRTRRGGMCC